MLIGAVTSLVLAWCTLACLALFFAETLMFPVPQRSYRDDSLVIKLPVEGVGHISAVLLRHGGTRRTILYSHGNGEDLGMIMQRLGPLRDAGFNVFAYDYPGYGTSDGEPTEQNVYAAADAAYRYLTGHLRLQGEEIVLYGRSLGGAPTLRLAARNEVGGVITESAFTSAFTVPVPRRLLWWDKFDNLRQLRQVQCPVLIIHGRQDGIVPFRHAEALLEAAPPQSQFLFVESGHNNVVEAGGEIYWRALQRYFALVQQDPPTNPQHQPDVPQESTGRPVRGF